MLAARTLGTFSEADDVERQPQSQLVAHYNSAVARAL